MHYQNQHGPGYRHRPLPAVVFRIYAFLWLIPVVFFLAVPTLGGFLITACIIIGISVFIVSLRGQKAKSGQQAHQLPPVPALLKQPSLPYYRRGYMIEESHRYDEYELPQAQYPRLPTPTNR